MLREKALGECILKVERAAVNDFPYLLKSFPVDFPLRASPLDRFYVRLGELYSLQPKKQARSRLKCSEGRLRAIGHFELKVITCNPFHGAPRK